MSGPQSASGQIESEADLVEYLASGNKPKDQWRIGTEHEKFGFRLSDHSTLPYEGPAGVRALLEGMQRFGWQPVLENGNVIALSLDGGAISLEPGGQFELVRRAAGKSASDLWRGEYPSKAGPRGGDRTWHRLSGAGFYAQLETFRNSGDAQGALWHHDQLHAQARRSWHRYDVPFVHGAGQSGLFIRSGHDQQIPGLAGACNRLPPRCSPILRSRKENQTAISVSAVRSGPTPIRIARAWSRSCSMQDFGFERYVKYALDVPMYFVYRNGQIY